MADRRLALHIADHQGAHVVSRTSVADLPTGPKEPRLTVRSVEEEAVTAR
ncbi:hypothetical protein GGD56_007053 [Rhizobium mongolense]|uniref:Uncharacterized protein n=1 Tax=Rhizobium mongolense TaxID=57676 RepID=A0ABR6IZT7_9HYPH|nr:hypothetical protein [Rhizobium mongolense]